MPDHAPLLELIEVATDDSRSTTTAAGTRPLLHGINLQLAGGRSLAIVGPSGSGKSTLLNIVAGLERPGSGQVILRGTDLARLTDDQAAAFRNQQVGLIFLTDHLLPQCTALQNVLIPTLTMRRAMGQDAVDRAQRLLMRVGMAARQAFRPEKLSVAERQRVALARALINQPPLLLADEPTGRLDYAAARAFTRLLVEVAREESAALIVATHSLAVAARMESVMELRAGGLTNLGALLAAEDEEATEHPASRELE